MQAGISDDETMPIDEVEVVLVEVCRIDEGTGLQFNLALFTLFVNMSIRGCCEKWIESLRESARLSNGALKAKKIKQEKRV